MKTGNQYREQVRRRSLGITVSSVYVVISCCLLLQNPRQNVVLAKLDENQHEEQQQQQYLTESIDWIEKRKQNALSTLPKDLLESSMDSYQQTGTIEDEPALQKMTYNIGDGNKETIVYIEPTIESMYANTPITDVPSTSKVTPKFNGFAGKFINLSNKPVSLHWEASAGGTKHLMRSYEPFTSSGTGTFPKHRFLFSEPDDPNKVLIRFTMDKYPHSIHYYDPYYVEGNMKQTEKNLKVLTKEERTKYDYLRRTVMFNNQYLNHTGRSYLANYLRPRPLHFMWPNNYFGQQHWVMTREKHYIQKPIDNELQAITSYGTDRILQPNQHRILHQYRDPTIKLMNMTLISLSVAPRVFLIPNFLSKIEVEHIIELAKATDLHLSKTGEGGKTKSDGETLKVRTSYNSWLPREKSPIIDSIYRRAGDLLRIDESLFRFRHATNEYNTTIKSKHPICEQLQLVHYSNRQEYQAHHDFQYNKMDNPNKDGLSARYATLLLYLNEGMVGGETTFPRWVNGETFKQLKVTPVVGNAVLFYNQLPDGNMDDLSEHAALPVTDGEKLINLWVWDPVMEDNK